MCVNSGRDTGIVVPAKSKLECHDKSLRALFPFLPNSFLFVLKVGFWVEQKKRRLLISLSNVI